jgi:hypothetical protein
VRCSLVNWRHLWGLQRLNFIIRAGSVEFVINNIQIASGRTVYFNFTEFIINTNDQITSGSLVFFDIINFVGDFTTAARSSKLCGITGPQTKMYLL